MSESSTSGPASGWGPRIGSGGSGRVGTSSSASASASCSARASGSRIVELNVGGRHYVTSEDTLVQTEAASFLSSLVRSGVGQARVRFALVIALFALLVAAVLRRPPRKGLAPCDSSRFLHRTRADEFSSIATAICSARCCSTCARATCPWSRTRARRSSANCFPKLTFIAWQGCRSFWKRKSRGSVARLLVSRESQDRLELAASLIVQHGARLTLGRGAGSEGGSDTGNQASSSLKRKRPENLRPLAPVDGNVLLPYSATGRPPGSGPLERQGVVTPVRLAAARGPNGQPLDQVHFGSPDF